MLEVQAELEEELRQIEVNESLDDTMAAEAEKLAHEQEVREKEEKHRELELKRKAKAEEEAQRVAAAVKE